MRQTKSIGPWVVYQMNSHGVLQAGKSVCEQWEWDALQLERPGLHSLIQEGIATEEEAEKLARGTSGDSYGRRGPQPKPAPQ